MNLPLAGSKTYVTAGLMLVIGIAEAAGVHIPGFDADPGTLVTGALGLIFARIGASNDAAAAAPVIRTGAAIALAFALVNPHPARAGDLKPVLKSQAQLAPANCSVADCSGWFAGFNIAGVGSNLDILGSGINNSVFAGGGMIGLNGGYQLWNGQFFAAAELMADADFNAGGINNPNNDKFFVAGLGKFGVALGNVLGIGAPGSNPTPSQAPLNLAVIPGTALLSPYVIGGGAWRKGRTGWVTGAGMEFLLAKGWNLDVSYMHINYQAGQGATVVPGAVVMPGSTENLVQIALKRMF